VEYFARCTGNFVGAATHVIVLDVAQVGGLSHVQSELPDLVASLKRNAPSAVILLLAWVELKVLLSERHAEKELSPVVKIALRLGVDVLRVDRIALSLLAHHNLVSHRLSRRSVSEHVGSLFAAHPPDWKSACLSMEVSLPPSFRTPLANRDLSRRPDPIREVAPAFLYAQRGLDNVHPTPEGHVLIGRAVAQYVANRLALGGGLAADELQLTSAPPPAGRGRDLRHINRSTAAAPSLHGYSPDPANTHELTRHTTPRAELAPSLSAAATSNAPSAATSAATSDATSVAFWETCYGAGALPVHAGTPPWTLTDEGGDKGVRKLGLVSRHLGDALVLGPIGNELQQAWLRRALASPTTLAAAPKPPVIFIELAYLLAQREAFGALELSCVGCRCKRLYGTFASRLTPFPALDTNANISPNEHYRDRAFNATITATTVFGAALDLPPRNSTRAPWPCLLRIVHAAAGSGLSREHRSVACKSNSSAAPYYCTHRNESRVRVDGLNAWGKWAAPPVQDSVRTPRPAAG
jgi:hypothetical protein